MGAKKYAQRTWFTLSPKRVCFSIPLKRSRVQLLTEDEGHKLSERKRVFVPAEGNSGRRKAEGQALGRPFFFYFSLSAKEK